MLLLIFVIAALSVCCNGQSCSVNISGADRRDCYPWPDASQGNCEARGCAWCPDSTQGVPWCYTNDKVCPSTVPEANRQDCHPEPGANKDLCLQKGCLWCETATSGIPWCFSDPDVKMGGEVCPSEITDNDRIDCFPQDGVTISSCVSRGCYWCSSAQSGVPWCFMPPSHGYRMVGGPVDTAKGYQIDLQRVNTPSWYGSDITSLRIDVEFHENHRLRVKIYDPSSSRFEVPVTIPSPNQKASNPLYDITFTNTPSFNFKITRVSTQEVLFDTSIGGLQFSDQFLQIAARLASAKVYGIGESEHHSFMHDMNWKSWGMWARDEPVTQTNLYSHHPFFTVMTQNNDMFGTLILNSNAQEVSLTPAPGIIYRTIGGILDLYFFLGPDPESVTSQYTEAIGRPMMPPYWALGFQLSRYGYNTLDNMKATVKRMRDNNIPHDVQHGDIDYFDRNLDFTYDPVNFAGLPDYVRQLKTEGTRFITLLDPFIGIGEPPGTYPPFDRGQELDIWVKESDGVTNAESRVWPPSNVYYPDYGKASGQQWWNEQCSSFHNTIEFDGLWVDMNEPASFEQGSVKGCSNNKWNNPLFKPRAVAGSILYDKTICTDYQLGLGSHYDTHSLYGTTMAKATVEATRQSTGGKRSLVISRSSFPSAGVYSGRWLGDNYADWVDLQYSIIGVLEFNLFGMPYIGADICGFFGDSYEALCSRWMQVGAFYPFSRNHNGMGWTDHDPGIWPSVAAVSRDALNIRYTLLPYFYTLFHFAHANGNTVFRSLMHEFPTDTNTHSIDQQFLWGAAFLVTPVTTQGATSVRGYFPDAPWYRYRDGVLESFRGSFQTISAPSDFIPLHVRGGHILATQKPANSTMFSRNNNMGLIVALDDGGSASGSLFWDEGDTPDTYENGEYFFSDFSASQRTLSSGITVNGYPGVSSLIFDEFSIWGVSSAPSSVTVNGGSWSSFTYSSSTRVLHITQLTLPVSATFTVNW